VLLSSHEAHAQSSTALERFEPPVPADPSAVWSGAEVAGTLRPAFALRAVYANAPLVLLDASSGDQRREVVSHQLVLHVQASLAILDRGLVEVDVPASLVLGGDAPVGARDRPYPEADGPRMNDVRVGGRFEVVEPDDLVPAIGLGLSVWLPVGDDRGFTSTGGVRFAPSLAVSADYGAAAWGVSVGRRFEPSSSSTEGGNLLGGDLEASAGGLGRVDRFSFGGGVLFGAVTPDSEDVFARRQALRVELLAEARAKLGPLELGVFGGPGLTRAPGTPRFRLGLDVTASFDAVPRERAPDRTVDGGSARDEDERVRAALAVGVVSAPGSSPDGLDASQPPAPVPEPKVEPAAPEPVARLEGARIVIFSPIEFTTGKADLLASSEATLREIVDVLSKHPEIARLAVDGHTDGKGSAQRNLELSRARALSVERWLVEHGVDARRLEARGFGAKQPIADNATEEGRAKNRRTELVILRRTTRGEAGWVDGTLTTEEAK
jgi:outer membrane protein OmpA-like peptidoglycan-associated protein